MRVFLDANVLFSASNEASHLSRLVYRLIAWGEAVTSEVAREEARRNLELKRGPWLPAFARLCEHVRVVPSVRFDLSVELADKDLPLLCAAIHSGCQYFATGDWRAFGHLYGCSIQGVEVIPLLRLAELVVERPDA